MTPAIKKVKLAAPILLLCLAILLGSFVRLSFIFDAPSPLNDGGLFYTMTRDLSANEFRIPKTSSYNELDIPFAYPPLQFVIVGLLSKVFGWELLNIFRLFPPIVACLCIPAFYLLARELLNNDLHASMASLIFSLTPAAFDWLIMGGGVTRAPAFCLALLSLVSIYRLYVRKEKRYIFISAVLASLTVLSHPETALHTAASALLFFLFFGRNRAGVLRSLLVAVMVLALTSPWWVTVLTNHGLSAFAAAGQTGWHNILSIFKFFFANQLSEYQVTPITVLALVGLFVYLAQKKFFLPIWYLVIFLAEPRSSPLFMSPVIAIFAAHALMKVMSLLNGLERRPNSETDMALLFSGKTSRILFGILFAQWIYSAYATVINLSSAYFLDSAERSAFAWVRENTPLDSRFMVLSGNAPFTDPLSEWFPAMTDRVSVGTVQGHEWLQDREFSTVLEASNNLQHCSTLSPDCFVEWSEVNHQPYDYIFIDINRNHDSQDALSSAVLYSANYSILYNVDGVLIVKSIGD